MEALVLVKFAARGKREPRVLIELPGPESGWGVMPSG